MHIDEICENITNTFINFCKICIPFNKVLIRPNDKPWFISELRYNIRLRDRLRKHAFKRLMKSIKFVIKHKEIMLTT